MLAFPRHHDAGCKRELKMISVRNMLFSLLGITHFYLHFFVCCHGTARAKVSECDELGMNLHSKAATIVGHIVEMLVHWADHQSWRKARSTWPLARLMTEQHVPLAFTCFRLSFQQQATWRLLTFAALPSSTPLSLPHLFLACSFCYFIFFLGAYCSSSFDVSEEGRERDGGGVAGGGVGRRERVGRERWSTKRKERKRNKEKKQKETRDEG